jgi:hypothetical protein
MAATGSKPNLTYAICYGFLESGPHGRRLRRRLGEQGYKKAGPAAADIIIAHSAGCWLIPKSAKPRLVIYAGMPLQMANPRRAWLQANLASLRRGNIKRNLKTRAKNTASIVRHPLRNLDIFRHPKIGRPAVFPDAQTVFIANRYDPWPRTDLLDEFAATQPWSFISLPGGHDDVWEHSDRYAAIIKHYARLLAETDQR